VAHTVGIVSSRSFGVALGLVVLAAAMPLAVRAQERDEAKRSGVLRARLLAYGAATGDFVGRVRISGRRRLYIECRGHGSPTVILEAGGGQNSRVWLAHKPGLPAVLPAIARFTRVCSYDRPGGLFAGGYGQPKSVSRSDPVAMPRTVRDMVLDLHALLRKVGAMRAAGVRGPYVLAGHSFGGMVGRLYATTYPREVAGLVEIDAQNEWFAEAYKRLLTPEQYANVAVYFPPYAPGFPGYSHYERPNLDASAAEMRQAQADTPLRPMPLVVLSHSPADPNPFGFPPGIPINAMNQAFNASQAKLVALVPGARHVIARRSGHDIQLDQPKLVIDAIRSVVVHVRAHPMR
jgi:pimeloyl-ACP methyl ester carboxylesterase